jgi:hypothetical protein
MAKNAKIGIITLTLGMYGTASWHSMSCIQNLIPEYLYNDIPRYKITYPGTKWHTWVQNCIPGNKSTYLGTKSHTLVQNYIPWYKITYPGTKLHTRIQNNIPGYKIAYPGTKWHTRVQNDIPGYKITYLGANLVINRPVLLSSSSKMVQIEGTYSTVKEQDFLEQYLLTGKSKNVHTYVCTCFPFCGVTTLIYKHNYRLTHT